MALNELIAPGESVKRIRPEELFFSTTDRRGLIRSGNSVFVRVSGFSLEELTGAPHNIVRHPDMPAGVFRLVWDRLLAGRPAGAYVRNLAKDGASYWVFATMTPTVDDGFLSVRMAPQGELFDVVRKIYRQVLDVERAAAARGLNRREVAQTGLTRLEQALGELGFGSHDEFLAQALSAEVAARSRLVSVTYARPGAQGPIADVLTGADALERLLGDLVRRLDGYRELSDRLARSSTQVLAVARRLEHMVATAQTASARVADTAPVLHNVARVMAAPTRTAVAALERLVPRLAELNVYLNDLRFRISLASLHTDMVAAFAAEVVDGIAPVTSLREVPLLCSAVRDSALEMSATAQQVNRTLREIGAELAEARERLAEFRRFLGQWRILVLRHRVQSALGDLVQPLDEEFAAIWDGVDLLRTLGEEFTASTVSFDVNALELQLARIQAGAAETHAVP